MLRRLIILLVVIALIPVFPAVKAGMPEVDVALVLAIDTSNSVNPDRYQLQMSGYAHAFRSPLVAAAIRDGARQAIAATVTHWCDPSSQRVVIPWTRLHTSESLRAFAAKLDSAARAYDCSMTSVAGGIAHATGLLDSMPFRASRKIIDVSGDGKDTTRPGAWLARNSAVQSGIVINGLAIIGIEKDVDEYYRQHIVGGAGSFLIVVNSYEQFPSAVRRKLVLEIADLR